MKIKCRCGELIHDLDHYKGHIVSGKDYFEIYDDIETKVIDALVAGDINQEQAYMKLRSLMPSRHAWQCRFCGTIYINKNKTELECFIPENEKNDKKLLSRPLRKDT